MVAILDHLAVWPRALVHMVLTGIFSQVLRKQMLSAHPDYHRTFGDIDPRLYPLHELRGWIADQEIDHCHHREDLEMFVGCGGEQLPAEHQVAHGYHRH